MIVDTAIVIPDQHFPIQDNSAVKVVLKAIQLVKPSIFINLGDVGEWSSVSSHKYKRRKRPPLEYQLPEIEKEIKAVNKQIDKFDKVLDEVGCKKKFLLAGNHDEWLDAFVLENPFLDQYTFRKACKWDERGYKYHKYNEVLTIGKLSFIHGAYTGANGGHTRQHLSRYLTNIMYGHVHDVGRLSGTSLAGNINAWAMGCLKDMSAENNTWLKGRLHNWSHAFGIVHFYKNGDFQVEVIDIIDGKACVWGNELR